VAERCKQADIVISTALIPGRPAPQLISAETVQGMKPGSVIVDLAVERGGNCPLSEKDQVVVKHGVAIIGYSNLPAMVFVMGAGVAGLQAIATARRLGAVVSATDVRRAAAEQVQSLGAKFVMVELKEDMQTEGGYARELSAEDQARQAELVAGHIKSQDIVITTALIPGRPAPKLVSRAMVESMKPGSVIVDLAVEAGGNCELTKPDEVIVHNGVSIVGYANMPSRIAVDASALYARNLLNFVTPLVDKETRSLKIDWDDEIIEATALTRDGRIIHPQLSGKG